MTPHLPNLWRSAATILLFLLILLSAALPAAAQGIIIDPPPTPPRPIRPAPVSPVMVESHRVNAAISGPVATVRVTQVFRNDSEQVQEGTFLFPLPDDAAISDFQMTVDGQVLEGKLLKKEEARRIYEEIVRQQRDPALLEYVGRDLFQASVFPIPARSSRTVELTYREIVWLENGLHRFSVPLGSRQNRQPAGMIAVAVELAEQSALRTLYSPSHQVAIERTGNDAALIGFESSDPAQQRDFTLYWGSDESAIGVNLLSYRPAGEDGFFLLLAAPALDVAADAVVERDIVLVLDVSGSMEGEKLAQAQDAVRFVVDHLNEGDRFNLISFSTGVDRWKGELQAADEESRASAHSWIGRLRATGSTDINRALLESLALLDNPNDAARPAYVLFLTDGLPTQGEENADRIVANAERSAPQERSLRLFTFGVGYDVNTDLLDEVSASLGGRSSYVRPDEQIDEAVSSFYAGVSTPVLSGLSVAFTDAAGKAVDVSDSYPFPLPDLFAGGQLVWVGRYETGGTISVALSGEVNGAARRFNYPALELVENGGESAVARLWATRKIGALLTAVRRNGADPETIDAIIELSLDYGIVTPYTSYLVEEPGMAVGGGTVTWSNSFFSEDAAPRAQAYAAAPAAIAESAAAEAAGEAAVQASQARSQLSEAEAAPEDSRVRFVAGKSFVQKGDVQAADGTLYSLWVDTALDTGMTPRRVAFGSAEYFALAADAQVAQWLSLSPALVLVIDGQPVQIVLDGAGDPVPAVQSTPEPAPQEGSPSPSFWQRLLDLLLGRD
ncbi:MAG: VWA domain-containing protein [Chloroflexi bacterium]|nr:VWA domain-containing protein [Chloroflexota bacterium]